MCSSDLGSFHQTALTRTELQALTWAHLGVERTAVGLRTLLDRLGEGARNHRDHDSGSASNGARGEDRSTTPAVPSVKALETANLALIAEHMARHALAREHSLGAHTRTDNHTDTTLTSHTALLQEATAC